MTLYPEQALRSRLVSGGPVRDLIADRLYPIKAPQNAPRPYATYRRISGDPKRHMQGACEIAEARLQFNLFADTYAGARALSDAVRRMLDGFKGEIVVGDAGVFYVRHLSLANEFDDFDDPPAGSDDGVYSVAQDWLLFYVLPAPTLA